MAKGPARAAGPFNSPPKGFPMKKTGRIVNLCILILGLTMIAYYIALGLAVRFGQSLQFLWLAVGLGCVARFAFWEWAYRRDLHFPAKPLWALRIAVLVLVSVFLISEAVILGAGFAPAPQGVDYVVVLGARVNGREPSGALRNRIQRAREYLLENPDTLAVLTGGKGSDEDISEAQCMYENLVAGGIDPARLILEDQATDTSENLAFSRRLIPEGASVALVTNNFHIFRSLALARGQGWDVEAIPVATSMLSLPHYLMREFIGVAYEIVQGNF